jgi:pyrroline-5-carboxylate reductase
MPPTSAGTGSAADSPAEPLSGRSVGIIGAGRLGAAIGRALIDRGLPRERLFLSIRGGPESRARLAGAGLGDRVVPVAEAAASCDIAIVAIRPQEAASLGPLGLRDGCAALSCMAGVPLDAVRRLAGAEAARGMTSGPDTILDGRGVAALCPSAAPAGEILDFLGLRALRFDDERLVDAFTAAVCMPAAIAAAGEAAASDIDRLAAELQPIAPVFRWAVDALPRFACGSESEAYVARMITPGGITERIVGSLRSGSSVYDAYFAGLAKAREIAASFRAPG